MAPSLSQPVARALPVPVQDPRFGVTAVPGDKFNNAGFLALFAILAAAMVIAAFYFFFVAKNGGFKKITKTDWDDYKTTVMRRKGPNGTTLSNATKSTKLGGGSVVPKWAKTEYTRSSESSYDDQEMREVEEGRRPARKENRETRHTSRHDPELAAYKAEKAAKVGGLNTSMHGSQWDASNTDRSDVTSAPVSKKEAEKHAKKAEKDRKAREKAEQKEALRLEKEQQKQHQKDAPRQNAEASKQRGKPSAAYSFQQGDDAESSIYTASHADRRTEYTSPSVRQPSYYESYRPQGNLTPVREQPTPVSSYYDPRDTGRIDPRDTGRRSHRSSRESMNRQGSPRKQHRAPRSDHTASSAEIGTKVYEHHIPGLPSREVGVEDSVSQVGARRYHEQYRKSQQPAPSSSAGFRRGGKSRGRGDELSEDDE